MLACGVLNNNPGRIRSSCARFRGEVEPVDSSSQPLQMQFKDEYRPWYGAKYKSFCDSTWGYRAIFLMIRNYDYIYGLQTVRSIIGRWAAGRETSTVEYARAVANRLGYSLNSFVDTLDREVMVRLVCSISKIENGVDARQEDVEAAWDLFAASLTAPAGVPSPPAGGSC